MKITILGTGTSQGVPVIGCDCAVCTSSDPKDKRLRVSVYVQTDDGTSILIDCSPDLRQQFLANKIEQVDAVLVTHEHNDHIIGLDDLRPINFKQGSTLPLYALPRVIKDLKARFHYVFSDNPYPGAPRIQTHTIENNTFSINKLNISCIEVMHGPLPILGFRIGDFAYITDIKTIDDREKQKLAGLKLLVISTLRKKEHFSHMNLDETLALVKELNPDKTYLTHMGHRLAKHQELEEVLPEGIYPAFDGLTLEV